MFSLFLYQMRLYAYEQAIQWVFSNIVNISCCRYQSTGPQIGWKVIKADCPLKLTLVLCNVSFLLCLYWMLHVDWIIIRILWMITHWYFNRLITYLYIVNLEWLGLWIICRDKLNLELRLVHAPLCDFQGNIEKCEKF